MKILEKIVEVAKANKEDKLLQQANEVMEKESQGKLYMAVLGLFKRGKSSLINAVLGKEIAPIAVTPLTAIVTVFQFHQHEHAIIHFNDHSEKQVDITQITAYVSEQENPENEKGVRLVEVFAQVPLLQKITLVDTPGLGSVFDHNTLATEEFIPRIDAALYVLSADLPITKVDAEFLSEIKGRVPAFIFAMNKVDLLDQDKVDQMLDFNMNKVQQLIDQSATIHAVKTISAGPKKGEGIQQIELLIEDMAREKSSQLLAHGITHETQLIGKNLVNNLQFKLETLQLPLADLESKKIGFNESLKTIAQKEKDFFILTEGKVGGLANNVLEETNDFVKAQKAWIHQKVWDHPLWENKTEAEYIQDQLSKEIVAVCTDFKKKRERQIVAEFQGILQAYETESDGYFAELSKSFQSLTHFNLQEVKGQFNLENYSAFYLRLIPDTGVKGVESIRKSIFASGISFDKKMKFKVEQYLVELLISNSSKSVSDIRYKIQESFRMFRYDLKQAENELIGVLQNTIEETLQEKAVKGQSVQPKIDTLATQIEELKALLTP